MYNWSCFVLSLGSSILKETASVGKPEEQSAGAHIDTSDSKLPSQSEMRRSTRRASSLDAESK